MHTPFAHALTQLDNAAALAGVSPDVFAQLQQPQRVIEAAIPVAMDSGQTRIFTAYRVQYNNARGPYKGGIRYHPQTTLEEIKALAFWMTIKCAAVNIPFGGGKGGVILDPKTLSVRELEALSRGFVRAMFPNLGPERDVPAPDVYTSPKIMAWMSDEFNRLTGKKQSAAFTGKPVDQGGSIAREYSTAQGGVFALMQLLKQMKRRRRQVTVAIQGFGNVGFHTARLLHAAGIKIVAVSDSQGGIRDLRHQGMDPQHILASKQERGMISGVYCVGTVCDMNNYQAISNEQLLALPVDVLVPAALENAITVLNASQVKAKIILEMANGAVTPEADEIFRRLRVTVVPDIVANAGGVVGSYLEWQQNMANQRWTEAREVRTLQRVMDRAFLGAWMTRKRLKTDLRTASWVTALRRIAVAIEKKPSRRNF